MNETAPTATGRIDTQAFSERLVQVLRDRFELDTPVAEPILYLLEHPGKGLRPELAYAVADACGGGRENGIFSIAMAGELLHLASLIHDDLVDGAQYRRGLIAVHHEFDPRTAVLAGDYMLGAAYALLSDDASEATLRKLGPAVHALAEAELLEIRARGQLDDVELSRRIALGKTGSLFGWIATGAAVECGEWAGENAWHSWGLDLGVLFQLADDMGDHLHIDEGKDVGLDAVTETPTLLTALLRQDPNGGALRMEVAKLLESIRRPPASGPRLQTFFEVVTTRAEERFSSLLEKLPL